MSSKNDADAPPGYVEPASGKVDDLPAYNEGESGKSEAQPPGYEEQEGEEAEDVPPSYENQEKNWSMMSNFLEMIYKEHNPEKVDSIPSILEKFIGKEEKMFAMLCEKYELDADSYDKFVTAKLTKEVQNIESALVKKQGDSVKANSEGKQAVEAAFEPSKGKEFEPSKATPFEPSKGLEFEPSIAKEENRKEEEATATEVDQQSKEKEKEEEKGALPPLPPPAAGVGGLHLKETEAAAEAKVKETEAAIEAVEAAVQKMLGSPDSGPCTFDIDFAPGSMGLSLMTHHVDTGGQEGSEDQDQQLGCVIREWFKSIDHVKSRLMFQDRLTHVSGQSVLDEPFLYTMALLTEKLQEQKTLTFSRSAKPDLNCYELTFPPGQMGLVLQVSLEEI